MGADAIRSMNNKAGAMGQRANQANPAGPATMSSFNPGAVGQSYSKSSGTPDALTPTEQQNAKQFTGMPKQAAAGATKTGGDAPKMGDGMPSMGMDGEKRFDAGDIAKIRRDTANQRESASKLLGS